ncbi:hypothetical protein ROV95_17870 [Stenotrophomonas maltophilia group sp. msm1]|uniref:hypothetical protein n=1 Tax=Stenotrophomonas maltophilia group sp. msm1 TaxID=3061099 RepID=UPI0028958829|nr:hypothetical protein [Stenotrophomonas maltophilia group sp. msm1]MDT3557966.1 hypothetical protein [Stenotrophomonas maltophilia group sp. msm1]
MYQLTSKEDVVICVETGVFIPAEHRLWEDYKDWCRAGNTALPAAPPYSVGSPQHYEAIRSSAWDWMTAWVNERRYDTIETCVGYYNSGVERYRLEARAMVAWRDQVNQALEQLVLAPPAGVVTWDQVRPLLPQPETFGWPDEVELPLKINETAVLE